MTLVSEIMTQEPMTVGKDVNLLECAKKMLYKRVKSLPIVEEGKLIGFISQRDILWAIIKTSPVNINSIKAIDISPKKIEIVKPSSSIDEVLKKMKRSRFERLPVVQDNTLVGMVTLRDILNFHPELYPELEEFAKIRAEGERLRRVEDGEFSSLVEGICEECGGTDILHQFNGMLICESCRDST